MIEVICEHIKSGHSTGYKPVVVKEIVYSGETMEDVFLQIGKQRNQWTYCNDDNIVIVDEDTKEKFLEWLYPNSGNPTNYIKCGGDMN